MPILFLYGTDEFAISRRLSEIAAKTDKDGMNTSRLEARLTNDEDLNNAVNSMPFLGDKRLVILANPSQKFNSAETKKRLTAFLDKVPPTTLLVLHETVEPKEAEKHWLVKWTAKAKSAKSEALMAPKAREMNGWIVNEMKRQGGKISSEAAGKLAELVGADTRQAAQEIAKVLAYVNWARPVEVQDVAAVCVSTAEVDIFAFVDSLAAGDGQKSQSMLRKMLEEQDAFAIFPMIIRQFRLLIQAREIVEARGMVQDVQEMLGVHPFVAGKVFQQAGRFTMRSLEAIYHRLLQMDEAAKTSAMPLDMALEMFVVELVGNK
jgi:DNA polymerase-3 subunit delta